MIAAALLLTFGAVECGPVRRAGVRLVRVGDASALRQANIAASLSMVVMCAAMAGGM